MQQWLWLWADAVEKGTVRFHIDDTQPPTRKDRITHKSGIIAEFCYFCIVIGYLFVIFYIYECITSELCQLNSGILVRGKYTIFSFLQFKTVKPNMLSSNFWMTVDDL